MKSQGGHEPGKPGKPGILREFEKPQGIQGKLREFQCYSGNLVRMRNLRTFCRIFSFSNLRASRLGFLCIFFGNETLSKLCECLFLDFHFSSDLNQ